MKKNKSLTEAINSCRFQKDRNWRNLVRCEQILKETLAKMSTLSEEQLTKKDIVYLVSVNCDYMRALNLYNYFKNELSSLLVMAKAPNAPKDE